IKTEVVMRVLLSLLLLTCFTASLRAQPTDEEFKLGEWTAPKPEYYENDKGNGSKRKFLTCSATASHSNGISVSFGMGSDKSLFMVFGYASLGYKYDAILLDGKDTKWAGTVSSRFIWVDLGTSESNYQAVSKSQVLGLKASNGVTLSIAWTGVDRALS